ncbi:hypothetical protein CB0940_06441 [Cercospora beticola]|uniref:Uncharacterized protein n=1 Tax=Cercospora beticola TaxID=122368 RepID=A0A2G5HYX3_CERBT|nr:hypothetical protein CB0940_06441 [Cercospora beticola]PIA97739.1 hypothetical protein CB0940_06441 [Cercospora beticola]WPA99077.1 hypothetical protein RHO25_003692 [Cercospora beticola]CAK1360384.1 unnamed protein product [Cercospora beticola]
MASSTLSAYTAVFTYRALPQSTVSYTATWSNLGPLTTVFTPPASCNTPVSTNLFIQARGAWGQHCDWTRTADLPRSECYPSYTGPNPAAIAGGNNNWLPGEQKFYYSPGYSCPAGWQAATTLTGPAPTSMGIWDDGQKPLALVGVPGTQVVCCPNAWTMGGLVQCYSRVETSTRLQACRSESRSFNHTNGTPDPTTGTTTRTGTTIVAYTTPAVLLVHDAPLEGGSGGSGNTTKIAVGVAVPVVVLLGLVAGILFCLRRRKRRREALQQTSYHSRAVLPDAGYGDERHAAELSDVKHQSSAVTYAKAELDGSDPSRRLLSQEKSELQGTYVDAYHGQAATEVKHDTGHEIGELEDTGRRHELGYATQAAGEVPTTLQPSRS